MKKSIENIVFSATALIKFLKREKQFGHIKPEHTEGFLDNNDFAQWSKKHRITVGSAKASKLFPDLPLFERMICLAVGPSDTLESFCCSSW